MDDVLKAYSGKKVLVTGGAGFIGSHMVEKLLELGARVTVIDIMLRGNKIAHLKDNRNLSIQEVDVTDTRSLAPLFRGQDYVFHLAAVVGVEETQDEPVQLLDVEIGGTAEVIRLAAANKVKRFIFASSSEVYGDSDNPMAEEGPFNPKSTYALCKLIGEHYCRAYYKKFGLEFTALRYFNSYGPRQDDRFVMSRFIRRALNGQELLIYGDGNQTRDFTFVGDSVHMSLLAGIMDSGINQIFNLGTGRAVSINRLADLVLDNLEMKGKVRVLHIDYDQRRTREIEVFARLANVDLAERLLQYRPSVDLETGMQRTIDWYLKQQP